MKTFILVNLIGILFLHSVNAQDWQQVGKTLPTGGGSNHNYGRSVAIDGDYAVVGAKGYAYITHFDGEVWQTIDTLTSSDGLKGSFGYDVAIDQDVVVVGCPYHGELNGGMVYVFEKPTSGWTQMTETARLSFSGIGFALLGYSVAIHEDVIVAGIPQYSHNDSIHGGVCVFEKEGEHWVSANESAVLTISEKNKNSDLGACVDIYNNVIVAGARYSNRYGLNSGDAMFWLKETENWNGNIEPTILDPLVLESYSFFGSSIAVSDSLIAIGTPNFDYEEKDNGIVFLFEKNGSNWSSLNGPYQLVPSVTSYEKYFGIDIDIHNQTVAVGARQDRTLAYNAGAVYLFQKPSVGWTDVSENFILTADDGNAHDYFGASVGITNGGVVAGAQIFERGVAYYFSDNTTTSSNEIEQDNSLFVFPNPSTGIFKIDNALMEIKNVEVVNLSGQTLQHVVKVDSNTTTIDLRNSPSGLYLLRMETSHGIKVCRLIKQE
jgi:hypothetical protein